MGECLGRGSGCKLQEPCQKLKHLRTSIRIVLETFEDSVYP